MTELWPGCVLVFIQMYRLCFFLNRIWMFCVFTTFFKCFILVVYISGNPGGWGDRTPPPPIWGFSLLKIWLKTMLCIVNNNVLYFNLNVHLNCVSSFTNGAKIHFNFKLILSLLHPCHRVFWSKCLLSSFTLPTHTSPVRENKMNSCGTAVSKAIKAIVFT